MRICTTVATTGGFGRRTLAVREAGVAELKSEVMRVGGQSLVAIGSIGMREWAHIGQTP